MQNRLDRLLDEYVDRVLRGVAPRVDELLAEHPELDDADRRQFRELIAALGMSAESEVARSRAATPTPPAAQAWIAPGAEFGHFRIERELGRGGQGVVFLAEDLRLHRRVALKLLAISNLDADSERTRARIARFEREALIASRIEHPDICAVYELGLDRGQPFVAMRYVEGESLSTHIQRAVESHAAIVHLPSDALESRDELRATPADRKRSISRVVELIEVAARALHAAHEQHVIHRDIKPGNIMVRPDGRPVLLDFGLARALEDGDPSLTATGEIFGSPGYMSPEQIAPPPEGIGPRTDIFSLSVVLFECLTLVRPFRGESRDSLYRAILEAEPPDARRIAPAIPRDLVVVLQKALEKSPSRRYATALDFADDLRAVREARPIRARPTPWFVRAASWAKRRPRDAAILTGVLLALAASAPFALELQARERAHQLVEKSSRELRDDPGLALREAAAGAKVVPGRSANEAALLAWIGDQERRRISLLRVPCTDFRVGPDAKRIALAWVTGEIQLVDGETWKPIAPTFRCEGRYPYVDLSRDGRWLATASEGLVAHFFSAVDGSEVFPADPIPARIVRWSPDVSRILALQEHRATIARFEPARIVELHTLEFPGDDAFQQACWSPDGTHVALRSHEKNVLWSVDSDRAELEVKSADASRVVPSFTRDGRRAAIPSEHGVCIYDFRTTERIQIPRDGERSKVGCAFALIDPDDPDRVFVDFVDGRAQLFSIASGESLSGEIVDRAASELSLVIWAEFVNERHSIVTFSSDGRVREWSFDADAGVTSLATRDLASGAALLERGGEREVLTIHRSGDLRAWTLDNEARRARRCSLLEPAESIAIDPLGRFAAVGSKKIAATVDLATRKILRRFEGHTGRVAWVDLGPGGDQLLTASFDGTIGLWRTADGEPIGPLRPCGAKVWCAAFSPDGRSIVVATEEHDALVLDAQTLEPLGRLHGHEGGVRAALYSRDGSRIVSTSEEDSTVRLWDAKTFELLQTNSIARGDGYPIVPAVDPRAERIAIACYLGKLRMWEPASDFKSVLSVGGDKVRGVQFSPDDEARSLFVASSTRDVMLRDSNDFAASGIRWNFSSDSDPMCFAFTRDGASIVVHWSDGALTVWPTDPARAVTELARSLATPADEDSR